MNPGQAPLRIAVIGAGVRGRSLAEKVVWTQQFKDFFQGPLAAHFLDNGYRIRCSAQSVCHI